MIEFIMKTEALKLLDRKKHLESQLASVNRKLALINGDSICISVTMLEKLRFNKSMTKHEMRELSRDWRRFFELPEHVQAADLERCNISVEKAGTNGRRFIRREF